MRSDRPLAADTMDPSDLALWALLAAATAPLCWAGWVWLGSFDFELGWRAEELLRYVSPLAAALVLGAPLVAGRLLGPRGPAFARGAALSLGLLALAAGLLGAAGWLRRDELTYARPGAVAGLALGLGWLSQLRRGRLLWLALSTALGAVGGWLGGGWGWQHTGLVFGLLWSLGGLPLAWWLRPAPGALPPSPSWRAAPTAPPHPTPLWRLALPGAALLAGISLAIGVGEALRPCAPLDRALGLSGCVAGVPIGDMYNLDTVAFAADGASVYLGGGQMDSFGVIRRVRLSDNAVLAEAHTTDAVYRLALRPGSGELIVVDRDGVLILADPETLIERRRIMVEEEDGLWQPSFSSDGRYAAFLHNTYDLESGAPVELESLDPRIIAELTGRAWGFEGVLAPDGSAQATPLSWTDERAAEAGFAYGYDVALLRGDIELPRRIEPDAPIDGLVRVLPGPIDQTAWLSFSPDGALLAGFVNSHYIDLGMTRGNTLRVWRVADGAVLHEEPLPAMFASNDYAWAPDGRTLAVFDLFGPVRIIRVGE